MFINCTSAWQSFSPNVHEAVSTAASANNSLVTACLLQDQELKHVSDVIRAEGYSEKSFSSGVIKNSALLPCCTALCD